MSAASAAEVRGSSAVDAGRPDTARRLWPDEAEERRLGQICIWYADFIESAVDSVGSVDGNPSRTGLEFWRCFQHEAARVLVPENDDFARIMADEQYGWRNPHANRTGDVDQIARRGRQADRIPHARGGGGVERKDPQPV